ncbi:MAG: YbjQ family protein [Bacteroidota bacterium]
MILSTTQAVAGKTVVRTIGVVKGNTIRARHIGKDITALLKNVFGGEIEEYTKLLAESREQALDRMIKQAEDLGANAAVEVRFSTSAIMGGAAEIMVYGTAVVVEDER